MYPGMDDTSSQRATPPLVFTTQFASTPQQAENSPALEPLHVGSYSSVVGLHRRLSNTDLLVNDSPLKVTCLTRGGNRSPYVTPLPSDALLDGELSLNHNHPYKHSFSYSGRTSPIQASPTTQRADFADAHHHHHGYDLSQHLQHPGIASSNPQSPTQASPAGTAQRVDFSEPHGYDLSQLAADPVAAQQQSYDVTRSEASEPKADALPSDVVHRALEGRCRFIPFPANLPSADGASTAAGAGGAKNGRVGGAHHGADHAGTNSALGLFIGQVRFETTPAELIWLIHRTSGACASHLESRGAGCYLLHCKSETDLPLVRSLHKRVLFDVGGVWLARTAEEVDALCEYVALDAPLLSRNARLPRDSMVVEELKVEAVGNTGGAGLMRHHQGPPPPQYNMAYHPHLAHPQPPPQPMYNTMPTYGMYGEVYPAPYGHPMAVSSAFSPPPYM